MPVCTNNALCLAVGANRTEIISFFNFPTFRNATAIKRIRTNVGGNGTIHIISYHRDGFDACAVLKSVKMNEKNPSDNLMYEYVVGLFLNGLARKYRCFIETYGIYTGSEKVRDIGINTTSLTGAFGLAPMRHLDLAHACAHPTDFCILIQCVTNTATLYEILRADTTGEFIRNHLLNVMYQLYYVLSDISDTFTHYDLHLDNVLVTHSPDPVKFTYGITFQATHIAKIIDYGRCFFQTNNPEWTGSSKAFYTALCAACPPKCGRSAGFNWFTPTVHHVNSTVVNRSIDLRALHLLKKQFGGAIRTHNPRLSAALDLVTYGKESDSGTPELTVVNNRINTVRDARLELEKLMKS